MNNYSQILYNKRRLIPQNINDEFEKNFAFIQRAVESSVKINITDAEAVNLLIYR